MKIAVVGTGYVGLVSGAGLADLGVEVVCVDVDEDKVRRLERGEIPFYEPGLDELVARNVKAGRLTFSCKLAEAVAGREVVLLAVGTPPADDGSADLSALLGAARDVAAAVTRPCVLVTKSTVPVGTADRVREMVAGAPHAIHVASNPEFLKEGDAVNDFLKPERIVIGTDDAFARGVLERLYQPMMLRELRILHMDTRSAELTKYAANAMLATRISFMNELAALCEKVGATIDDVRRGIASDSRIGKAFLYAGVGYGGSCFPKDVAALLVTARQHGVVLGIADATQAANQRQRGALLAKLLAHFKGELAGRTVAVWGLAFKPRTDDIRDAPALPLIEGLLAAGAKVRAYDRAAIANARARFGDKVHFTDDEYAAVDGASALCLLTEWAELRMPDWDEIKRRMGSAPVVFDGRNIYSPAALRDKGFTYVGIGR
ncbi:MAG: UDP-glucose/GDP-mannose dehydrogenase family protein [Deltaproteobacteria bacterium]|nr:UDP-glucose/GDP-mannose dehydrogenase family protein [Deltaproteobacteria bacterium]